MTAELKKLPIQQLEVYGIMGSSMIPLATYGLLDPSKRQEVIDTILKELSENANVVLGPSLIKTENFDGFRIM